MGWNIGILCIKAEQKEISNIIPDIFYKSGEGLFFEDITSITMGIALGVGYTDSWIILVDTMGRFIKDEKYPDQISKKYKVKSFWVAENMIYRDYNFGIIKKGGLQSTIVGREAGLDYLKKNNIGLVDNWGETIIFQIIENDIFNNKIIGQRGSSLMNLKYEKYEMD